MLVALAAAVLSAVQPADAVAKPVVVLEEPRGRSLSFSQACPGGGRIQTGHEPALLYREQDRAVSQLKKLAEMPPGRLCLAAAGPDRWGRR